jgi:FdhE protein
MSETGAPAREPVPIGAIAAPPFVRLPDPSTHFRLRAQRFAVLALDHDLAPYLRFMAGLTEAQHQTQDGLPELVMPTSADQERARMHAMPPLNLTSFKADTALDATFNRFFALASEVDMPAAARAALDNVTRLDGARRAELTQAALDWSPDAARLAEHTFVAAAVQAHFARLASRLDGERLVPVGDGVCPACSGPPSASLIVRWPGAHGTRFCACSICSTLWHVVRIKCVSCGSTEGIEYEEVADGPGARQVRAETCRKCKSYVKIMLQTENAALDPVADDIATIGLDILMRETGIRRAGANPFLVGY